MENRKQIEIQDETDILIARKFAREYAQKAGFGVTDVTRIVTAASELARNIFKYAGKGCMTMNIIDNGEIEGVEFIFEDDGPGIQNIDQAMQTGYSTSKGFGMGLPGAKRLMDEMLIESEINNGTKVIVRKWLGYRSA